MTRSCAFLMTLLLSATSIAGEESRKTNPLAKLPSKPDAAHIGKIKALGDNSWLNLGQAAADNRFPRKTLARGRAWGSKMAYSAELGGAFFCGTGVHGAMPDGYYMDDLWFYDANAHKWICLYPGATKATRLKLDKNGFEVTLDGKQNPVSYLSHAYSNTAYVAHLKKYMMIHRPCPWWTRALPQRAQWLGIPKGAKLSYNYGKLNLNTRHPIYWDTARNCWDRDFVKQRGGPEKSFCGVLEYIPSRKQAWSLHHGKTWYYDFAARKWSSSGARKGPSGYDANSCFDPKNERVYVAQGGYFQRFDIKNSTWHDLKTEGQPGNLGSTNRAQMHFDVTNQVVVWHQSGGPIFVYDHGKNRWQDMGNTMTDKAPYGGWHGFYHKELNVHLFYVARDSGNKKATWLAYRYKRAGGGSNPAANTEAVKKPMGQIVNGLQLSISATKTRFKEKEFWIFDTRAFNRNSTPLVLDTFDGQIRFEIDGPGGPLWPLDRVKPQGAAPKKKGRKYRSHFRTVTPNTVNWLHGSGQVRVPPGQKIPWTRIVWPVLPPGKYKVRWIHENQSEDDTAKFKVKIKEWKGKVQSNELEVTVTE
jgi:hypothetical protein